MDLRTYFRRRKVKYYKYLGLFLCTRALYNFAMDVEQEALISSETLSCENPHLDPFDPSLMKFYEKIPPLDCSANENWITITKDGSSASIRKEAESVHGTITCSFAALIRKTQEINDHGPVITITSNSHYEFENSDFAVVNCKAEDRKTWKNVVAGVRSNVDLGVVEESYSVKKTPNVLILGFDSISRNQYIRMLPKTYRLLTAMGVISLNTYNIVGDGTPAALIPILTGQTEKELPEVRKTVKGGAFVGDAYPFIWKEFKNAGYVTMYGEDVTRLGTWTYRLKGFNTTPTDHYMEPFYKEQPEKECFMGTSAHLVALQFYKNILWRYSNRPKFLLLFLQWLSHDSYNNIQKVDDDVANFILDLKRGNILEESIFFFMSDHGPRYSEEIVRSHQGKLEERMPMFSILFPSWFKTEHPAVHEALEKNQDRLTTPFDIYDTLKDILEETISNPRRTYRSQSLFAPIPNNRSCDNSGIEAHWCACQDWQYIATENAIANEAAKALVDTINKYTGGYRQYCRQFELKHIDKAAMAKSKKEVLGFVRKVEIRNDHALLEFDTNGTEATAVSELVQVSIVVEPGTAKFEATMKHQRDTGSFTTKIDDISRTNKYGNQPHCIIDINISLRKFCICE